MTPANLHQGQVYTFTVGNKSFRLTYKYEGINYYFFDLSGREIKIPFTTVKNGLLNAKLFLNQ